MKKSIHTIQQQYIEVGFAGLDDGVGMQDRLAEIFYSGIQPKMNLLFDDIANDGYLLSLDKLEIDCGILPAKNWEDEFIENTLRKLKAELLTKHKKELLSTGEMSRQAEEALLYFLEHGHLPWNTGADSLQEVEVLIQVNSLFIEKLRIAITGKEELMKRFVNSISEAFTEKILSELKKEKHIQWKLIQSSTSEDDLPDKNNSIEFLRVFLSDKHNDIHITPKEKEKYNSKESNDKIKKIETEKNEIEKGSATIYINNAGIILLHPFLPQLFEIAGLYKENKWNDTSSQFTAVKVLEYLCTGKNEVEEIHFSLNKILCGLKPADFVDDKEPLLNELMSSCDSMLGEVIGYWHQLKNTSIETLRETFLQRRGKLSVTGNGWLLQVEQKAVDVLLDSLQWGIGIIKLSWMKEIVYTEWR